MQKPFLALLLSCIVPFTSAEEPPLYTASAEAVGGPFELTVREIRRENNRSYLAVPGFAKRTAAQSRWLNCTYADLAMKRGYTYFSVVYPDTGSETVTIGLSNTPTDTPKQLLGNDYAAQRMPDKELVSTDSFAVMCSI